MEHATETASAAPAGRANGHERPALDHPVEGESRPSLWARFTARLRDTDRPDETPAPAPAPPVEPRAEAPTRTGRTAPGPVVRSAAARNIALALVALLGAVILVAFRGSWTSQSDAAKASHFDDWGAWLYPFAPDGLIVLALVAAVVLRHKFWPRVYCLFVVALFTATSYVVNHLHGLGTFEMLADGQTLVEKLDPWIVGLVSVQLVGAITFGSHILMHVFRHLFPEALDVHGEPVAVQAAAPVVQSAGPVEMSDPQPVQDDPERAEADAYEFAKLVYATCLDGGVKLSQAKLSTLARISKRKAGYVQVDIDNERAAAEEPEPDAEEAATVPAARPERVLTVNGSAAASGPAGGAA